MQIIPQNRKECAYGKKTFLKLTILVQMFYIMSEQKRIARLELSLK